MKAVVWQAPGQIELEEVPDARIEQPSDAVVRLTMSAICGTDLHMVRGTLPDMVPGTVLGHEGVGVVEAVGTEVRAFVPGDRVVIPSTICCGVCSYCRAGYTSQCDNANPNGPAAGKSFFGGPVGQLAIDAAWRFGTGRVIAVDNVAARLETARSQHAEPVDFSAEDPVVVIGELTGGIGADRVIDAVGVDAYSRDGQAHEDETAEASGGEPTAWGHGTAPSQAAQWAVESVAKAGSIGIIGVYPPTMRHWPIGAAMNKNMTVKMGNCPHRAIIPQLVDPVARGVSDPARLLTQIEPIHDVISAYQIFDTREPGWVKVALAPVA
jgi:threonine dehydrogenase-like Zn-dependent dehydrogenase